MMMGFLKRDWALICTNLRFYLCFILCFCILAAFSDFSAGFASLYVVLFSGTSILSLFSYDEANHWEAYAAASGGRRTMVDARYLLSVFLGLAVFLLQLLLGVMNRADQLEASLLYSSMFFLYTAIILPISYRFGGTRSRIIMIVIVGVFSGLMAIGVTSSQVFSDDISLSDLNGLISVALPLGSLLALAVSHRISRAIMARKEL